MIIIIWSDHDGSNTEKFGEGLDGMELAEAKLLELHNLEKSDDGNGTTIDMVIRGNEVEYEVKEVASTIKIKNAF